MLAVNVAMDGSYHTRSTVIRGPYELTAVSATTPALTRISETLSNPETDHTLNVLPGSPIDLHSLLDGRSVLHNEYECHCGFPTREPPRVSAGRVNKK